MSFPWPPYFRPSAPRTLDLRRWCVEELTREEARRLIRIELGMLPLREFLRRRAALQEKP